MNIIIAGAGKVGFNLAKTLCVKHSVTVIDQNRDAIDKISESLDILPIEGDVEDSNIYKPFVDKKIDLFIAVTNIDNVNLVSTIIADTIIDIDKKFVRLKQHFFEASLIQKKLGINHIIFPIKLASDAIASLLEYPKANNIKFFKYTNYRLASVQVSQDIGPIKINEIEANIIGIERKKRFFIPNEDDLIIDNDLVYFFATDDDVYRICNRLSSAPDLPIEKCVVFGGEELGISIAQALIDNNKNVKLVEKDLEMCEIANEKLKGKATVINSKYGTMNIIKEEGFKEADIFISATKNDEYNIIKCLEAKNMGIPKVIAMNNEIEYYNLMHSLDIIVMRGPKMSAYNTIMEEINSSDIILQKNFCGAKAIVYMRKIFPNSKLLGKKVKYLNMENINLFYIRDKEIYKFKEKIILQKNDLIITFWNYI
ncbi:Trk system potassium uptake protein TrkA [hydrothermal vent metagenome]|uniref:Trk system potassium uptake protein TrkA n=1 Tax=hydrothermal vent metagenome TaxID=652676 RepID=A0A1W1EJT8_9ZZZZ